MMEDMPGNTKKLPLLVARDFFYGIFLFQVLLHRWENELVVAAVALHIEDLPEEKSYFEELCSCF